MVARFRGPARRKKRKDLNAYEFSPDLIYLNGMIVDVLPGTRFKAKVERSGDLEDLMIDCSLKTIFKVKRFRMIRGDKVTIELDPTADLSKGVIVQVKREFSFPKKNK